MDTLLRKRASKIEREVARQLQKKSHTDIKEMNQSDSVHVVKAVADKVSYMKSLAKHTAECQVSNWCKRPLMYNCVGSQITLVRLYYMNNINISTQYGRILKLTFRHFY